MEFNFTVRPTHPLISLQGRLRPAKLFRDAVEKPLVSASARPISMTSVAFDDSGERCLTAGEDEAFVLWDAHKGKWVSGA